MASCIICHSMQWLFLSSSFSYFFLQFLSLWREAFIHLTFISYFFFSWGRKMKWYHYHAPYRSHHHTTSNNLYICCHHINIVCHVAIRTSIGHLQSCMGSCHFVWCCCCCCCRCWRWCCHCCCLSKRNVLFMFTRIYRHVFDFYIFLRHF